MEETNPTIDRIERILEVFANTRPERCSHDFAVLHRTLDIMREALRRLSEKPRAGQL